MPDEAMPELAGDAQYVLMGLLQGQMELGEMDDPMNTWWET